MVTDGQPDTATLLKQCKRRRLIATRARRRRKQCKRLGLAIPVTLRAMERKALLT